ncbi:MAG: ribonuclease HII, partial [Campylobacterales bacterium]|nr:ribonuclease HII [Campylobacterales bacterium]
HIVFVDNTAIDRDGLSLCIKNAILEIMDHIEASRYLMDGNTSFGIEALEHLIKADATIQEVSAASILAKVSRDRYMVQIAAKEYPMYYFEKHKGYGTQIHKEALEKYGFSPIHRKSYRIKGLEHLYG